MPVKLEPVVKTGHSTAGVDKASMELSETEILQACISHLQEVEDGKKYLDVRRKDNVPMQNRIAKLIGNKPLFDCLLNGVETRALLDSGSMVSVMNEQWATENFPNSEIRPISE